MMETASARDQVVEEELSDQEEVRIFENRWLIHTSTCVTLDRGRGKLK